MICQTVSEDALDEYGEPISAARVFSGRNQGSHDQRIVWVFDSNAWTLRDLEEPQLPRYWASAPRPHAPIGGASEVSGFDWENFGMIERPLSDDKSALLTQSLIETFVLETNEEPDGGVIEVIRPRSVIFRKEVKFKISALRRWRPKINIAEDFAEG